MTPNYRIKKDKLLGNTVFSGFSHSFKSLPIVLYTIFRHFLTDPNLGYFV